MIQDFDPKRSYSKTFAYVEHRDPITVAHAHAKEMLPVGTVYEVRSFDRRDQTKASGAAQNDKNDWRAGWFYEPQMQAKAEADPGATKVRGDGDDGGFLGRFTVR